MGRNVIRHLGGRGYRPDRVAFDAFNRATGVPLRHARPAQTIEDALDFATVNGTYAIERDG